MIKKEEEEPLCKLNLNMESFAKFVMNNKLNDSTSSSKE